jgi:hypothetical protein
MSFLLTIWSLSLIVLSAISGFAFAYKKNNGNAAPQSGMSLPSSFGDFLADQCHDVFYYIQKGVHHAKPHARNLGIVIVKYSQRGHDLFVERVFGRIETKKGVSTSFFLKSIAEHKVDTRAEGNRG